MLAIGLTGGIGTGKSAVSRFLQEKGAAVIDADRVGHEVYLPNTETWREVVRAFGEGVLAPTGEIDRKKLGAIVFADPRALARLNAIVHPQMARVIADRLDDLRRKGAQVAVLEAAILLEAGWDALVNEVWVVHSPEAIVIERLARRSGLTPEEVGKRVRAQLPFEERRKRAAVIVENAGDLDELKRAVDALWNSRVVGRSSKDA